MPQLCVLPYRSCFSSSPFLYQLLHAFGLVCHQCRSVADEDLLPPTDDDLALQTFAPSSESLNK